MRRLFLIRHAKSSWADMSVNDFDRKLNKRGKRDAPFMGKRLAQFKVQPDAIYSSPAKRARKTARAIAKKINFSLKEISYKEELYTFSTQELLQVISALPDLNASIFLVGHNSAITDTAVFLTGASIDNVPTTGIVGIDLNIDKWRHIGHNAGDLLFFDFPKKHRGLE